MSKRAEIHSSNTISNRGILRNGKEFKGKGQYSNFAPGFRHNVSFAEEEEVEDLLNASQLAQAQQVACLAEAAEREKKGRRVSCGEHEKTQKLDESNLDLSVEPTQASPSGSPATPIFSPRNISHTSTPRNLSESLEFNHIKMTSVVTEEPATETQNKYVTTEELAKVLNELKSVGIIAKDDGDTIGEELGETPTTTSEGVAKKKKAARKVLPSAMSDDEDGWEYVFRDNGATLEEEDKGKTIARSAPSEFRAIPSTAFNRVVQVAFQGDKLLGKIREYVTSLNREVILVDDQTLQDQYSNVEFHVCEEALRKTMMMNTSLRNRMLARERMTLGNKKAVTTCVNLCNNSRDLLLRKMNDFMALAGEMSDDIDDGQGNMHELISGHMKGAKRTPIIGSRLYDAAKKDLDMPFSADMRDGLGVLLIGDYDGCVAIQQEYDEHNEIMKTALRKYGSVEEITNDAIAVSRNINACEKTLQTASDLYEALKEESKERVENNEVTCFDEEGMPKKGMMNTSKIDRLIISIRADIRMINDTIRSSISVLEKEKFIQDMEDRLDLARRAADPFMDVPELERQLQKAEDAIDHVKKERLLSGVRKESRKTAIDKDGVTISDSKDPAVKEKYEASSAITNAEAITAAVQKAIKESIAQQYPQHQHQVAV